MAVRIRMTVAILTISLAPIPVPLAITLVAFAPIASVGLLILEATHVLVEDGFAESI
jgi:hypothetical protein